MKQWQRRIIWKGTTQSESLMCLNLGKRQFTFTLRENRWEQQSHCSQVGSVAKRRFPLLLICGERDRKILSVSHSRERVGLSRAQFLVSALEGAMLTHLF